MTTTPEQLESWIERHVIDKDGHRVGTISDIYIDDATGTPEWLAVTTGLFGTRISFVPLEGATEQDDRVKVKHEKSMVKDSPNIDADGELSEEEEARLYRHYGLIYSPDAEAPAPELAESGSASVGNEVTPAIARRRLRRRDAQAVDYIDLDEPSNRRDTSQQS